MRQFSAERITRATHRAANAVLELENGAHMDQPTFHSLYKDTPEGFRAQLIGGIVYVMASPVSIRHGRTHARAVYWLTLYSGGTPGSCSYDVVTDQLGPKSEPEPDASLVVLPEFGGQTTVDEDDYLVGPPELIVEVANTTRAIDLGAKKLDYEQAGVGEYVVILPKTKRVRWFLGTVNGFIEVHADEKGVFRSLGFPGLWLDPRGLFEVDPRKLTRALRKGLASPEHAAFVKELAARKKKLQSKSRKKK